MLALSLAMVITSLGWSVLTAQEAKQAIEIDIQLHSRASENCQHHCLWCSPVLKNQPQARINPNQSPLAPIEAKILARDGC